ncbi:hypothetical protein [Streptacidiphilus carbonis]|uniref:hypothetical protein n=1 Tax=Streptacidiphilus carbonis TaxID=105422 RepID=UPI0005AA9E17|nr:hypothetical protein [Streptacidiphilus carbonis]
MQLSTRASTLLAEVEDAAHAPAQVTRVGARLRIAAPIAADLTIAQFQCALEVVQRGDDWGSTSANGTVIVWSEINETEVP